MERTNCRVESHVAQQSRRDKLRFQQSSSLETLPRNYCEEQLSVNLDMKPDLIQVRNARNANLMYDASDFLGNLNVLGVGGQSSKNVTVEICQQGISNLNGYTSMNEDMCGGLGNWRGLPSQQSSNWMVNSACGSAGSETPAFAQSNKPGYKVYQDVQSGLSCPSSEMLGHDCSKHYGDMHFCPSQFRSSIQEADMLALSSNGQQSLRENVEGSWADGGNGLAPLPVYGNQTNDIAHAWMKRPVNHFGSYFDAIAKRNEEELRNVVRESNAQGLSLSLSSDFPSQQQIIQFGESYEHEELHSRIVTSKEAQDLKDGQTASLCPIPKPSIIHRGGKSDVGTISRFVGPLGPFTGYATILNTSKFLKPAQQLLDEFCSVSGLKLLKTSEISDKISGDVSVSTDANEVDQSDVEPKGSNLAVSSSTLYCSNNIGGDVRTGSTSSESYRHEYQQRKAKLLYMQEEVCKRYKQYHQQMQMVVSSFESVVGLSSATPYLSIALKNVSRHFRCLKHAILDQLRGISKVLGEELSSPTTGTSCSKDQVNVCMHKYGDQSFQKQKPGDNNVSFFERRVWRAQRGLPERAVAVLRAWLFEHFLHPYPTDTDKHGLATQTGLSRNQVSNWFINARVRLWKPMVEEIHMLENEGAAKVKEPSSKLTERPVDPSQSFTSLAVPAMAEKQSGLQNAEYQKRPRVDCQIPATMDPSPIGFLPYQRTGLEIGGTAGTVSLTLGLRHNVETAQQQLQQQEDQIRWQFGGPLVHDFVG